MIRKVPTGYRVRYQHERRKIVFPYPREGARPVQGGWAVERMTTLALIHAAGDKDEIIAEARSVCSDRDQYDRRLGNRIALGRALKAMEMAQASMDETVQGRET